MFGLLIASTGDSWCCFHLRDEENQGLGWLSVRAARKFKINCQGLDFITKD